MPAATTTDVFDVPPIAVLWPILLAGGVYLVLRSLIRGARGRVFPATAFRHALCVGVIGWLVHCCRLPTQASFRFREFPKRLLRSCQRSPGRSWAVWLYTALGS